MKKLDGSELNMFERAKVNLCLADRVQSVFADAALEVELTEDDIKSTLLNYLSTSTGKDWHLSSSVTLYGDVKVSQQIEDEENNHLFNDALILKAKKKVVNIALKELILDRRYDVNEKTVENIIYGIDKLFSCVSKFDDQLAIKLELLEEFAKTKYIWLNDKKNLEIEIDLTHNIINKALSQLK